VKKFEIYPRFSTIVAFESPVSEIFDWPMFSRGVPDNSYGNRISMGIEVTFVLLMGTELGIRESK